MQEYSQGASLTKQDLRKTQESTNNMVFGMFVHVDSTFHIMEHYLYSEGSIQSCVPQ